MFLPVPAYPGSPRQKAVKRLCVCVSMSMIETTYISMFLKTVLHTELLYHKKVAHT